MLIRSTSPESDGGAAIELTPIIDMVFLLLIFFLVATTFQQTEREMQIALPDTESGGPISVSLKEIIVNVTSQGVIIVAGREVSTDALRTIVTEAVDQNPGQKVTVRGDKSATYEAIVREREAIKASGVPEPFLDTVPVE